MFNYAQIDELGYCIGLSTLSGEVSHDNMILLEKNEVVDFGQKYDQVNKVWTNEFKSVEPQVPQVTLEDVQSNVTATKTVAMSTEGTVMMTSEDALTIMELQLENQALLNQIITKLGI